MRLLYFFYGMLALAGLLVPWYYNLEFIRHSQVMPAVADYFRDGTATPLAASLTWDLLITATAGSVFMVLEMRRLKMKYIWLFVVGSFLIAFAFVFPLFLLYRERVLEKLKGL